jgi:Divergent InlB B-repeat domain
MRARSRCYWRAALIAVGAVFAALAVAPAGAETALAWSAPASIEAGVPLLGVSCVPAAPICVAFDNSGDLVTTANALAGMAAWSAAFAPESPASELNGISCVTGPLCAAVDSNGNVVISTDPAGGPLQWHVATTGDSNLVLAVSCLSASSCVAVDDVGNALVSATPALSGSWSATAIQGATALLNVSCVTGPLCVATDDNGAVAMSTDPAASVWGAAEAVDPGVPIDAVSCPSSSLCVAADEGGGLLTWTGALWAVAPLDGATSIDNVACPSMTFCVAVDGAGSVLVSTDPAGGAGTWGTSVAAAGDQFNGVSCATTSLCVIVDQNGAELTGAPAVTGAGTPPAPGGTLAPALTPRHTLSVAVAGSGTVSFASLGISCSSACSASGVPGSYAGTAVAASGSRFTGWGGACAGTGTCAVTLEADASVTAKFAAVPGAPHVARAHITGTTVAFKLTAPRGASAMQCALVREPSGRHARKPRPAYVRCGASVTYRHLRRGRYVFYARVLGADGVESAAATRAFEVARA